MQLGHCFGRDFQTDVLTLSCARLCLTRWGQVVNIYKDAKLGKPDTTLAEVQTVQDILLGSTIICKHREDLKEVQAQRKGRRRSLYTLDGRYGSRDHGA
jgi:hypothetical protein